MTGSLRVYIHPLGYPEPFMVHCAFDGGGLLYIQERQSPCLENFARTWIEYRDGFGDVTTECYWLGNTKIAAISQAKTYKLRIRVRRQDNGAFQSGYYTNFWIDSESLGFALHYYMYLPGTETPTPLNVLTPTTDQTQNLMNMEFHTYDRDTFECSAVQKSGWWYNTGCATGDANRQLPVPWPVSGPNGPPMTVSVNETQLYMEVDQQG
jgi:hypothetical protein